MRILNAVMRREPALIYGLVNAGLALLAAFGLDLSAEQVGACVALLAAIFALITRQSVYSPATVSVLTDPEE